MISCVCPTAIINNAGTLNTIASVIFNFWDDNDAILYFYCAKDAIIQRGNRPKLSPQEYRSRLFSAMFDKRTSKHEPNIFINRPVILRDEVEGDHCLHFIAKSNYSDKIDEFAQCMEKRFGK